ncbi:hypothetical protein BE04_04535 [Sorangium cellulosum]|uniref:Uncharacterized protein n=1 Tax=Sorangium cellulosum TaxID=56 RepID=A0A150P7W8_SORCE|nr:hypothetical protein BE04_04535 [Sorangium cellulosum]
MSRSLAGEPVAGAEDLRHAAGGGVPLDLEAVADEVPCAHQRYPCGDPGSRGARQSSASEEPIAVAEDIQNRAASRQQFVL